MQSASGPSAWEEPRPDGARSDRESDGPDTSSDAPGRRGGDARAMHESTRQMLDRWLEGETLAAIAKDYGISRQAVHSRILGVATLAEHARAVAAGQRRREKLRADREHAERTALEEAAIAAQRYCPIDGKLLLHPWQVTCGGKCADDYRDGRLRLDEGQYLQHRLSRARSIMRHPERHRPGEVRLARRVLSASPPPPNRRFRVEGSRASEVERQVRGEAA